MRGARKKWIEVVAVANGAGQYLVRKVEVEDGVRTASVEVCWSRTEALARVGQMIGSTNNSVELKLQEGSWET